MPVNPSAAQDAGNTMQLNHLPIGRRLVLGFAVLLALVFFGNAAALLQFTAIEDVHKNMVERDWVQAKASHFVDVTTRENAVRTLELLLVTDPAHQAQVMAAIDRNKRSIDKALSTLSDSVQSPQERVFLGQLVQARTHYGTSFTRVAELVSQGLHDQAAGLMKRETLPAITALQASISVLAERQNSRLEAQSLVIRQHLQSSRNLMLVLVGMGLFLGFVVARAIARSITQPIEQALLLAQKVANGDFSGGIRVQGRDEMAHLLQALLDMNDSLVSLRLHALLNVSIDAVIQMDDRGYITGWNAQAAQCFGWTRDEALGKHVQDLIIPARYRHATLQGMAANLSGVGHSILNARVEVQALHQAGHEFPIELAVSGIHTTEGSGYIAFVRDITHRRQAEADSRIAALAFESLEAMAVTDAEGVILKVNDAYTRITGYCKEEAIGKTSALFRDGQSSSAHFHLPREALARHRFWQGEVSDRRKGGEDYAAWLRLTAVSDHAGVVTHHIVAFVDITENKQFQEKIHGLSYVDTLTGLPNRRALLDRLEQILAGSERKQDFGAILLVDLDHFKLVNDARGREQGDSLLQQVVTRIKNNLHPEDLLARVDGDSFAVVLSGLDAQSEKSASKAKETAERIRLALCEPFDTDGGDHRISSSIGICLFRGNGIAADLLVEHADAAMYKAKRDGRNCICFYDPATQAALEQRFKLITWLHKALPNELRLHYQVQVDSAGIPTGAETLVRWQHPEMGLISPAMFIPLAEETGLILPIGEWILNTACQQLARWAADSATSHLKLAVNVSAKQFLEPDFADKVLGALSSSGANPGLLKLELTESVMVSDADSVVEKMLRLRQHGVRFSLDDFGTGYSSLAYLKRLPLEQLKIDQSFVRNLLRDANDTTIVRAVINLGQSLGLEVIAEGVETTAQRDVLTTYGCDYFQGYLFGRPQPLDKFERMIHENSMLAAGS